MADMQYDDLVLLDEVSKPAEPSISQPLSDVLHTEKLSLLHSAKCLASAFMACYPDRPDHPAIIRHIAPNFKAFYDRSQGTMNVTELINMVKENHSYYTQTDYKTIDETVDLVQDDPEVLRAVVWQFSTFVRQDEGISGNGLRMSKWRKDSEGS